MLTVADLVRITLEQAVAENFLTDDNVWYVAVDHTEDEDEPSVYIVSGTELETSPSFQHARCAEDWPVHVVIEDCFGIVELHKVIMS